MIKNWLEIAEQIKYYQENDPCHHLKNEKIQLLYNKLLEAKKNKNKEIIPILNLTKIMIRNCDLFWKRYKDPNPFDNFRLINRIIKVLKSEAIEINANIKIKKKKGTYEIAGITKGIYKGCAYNCPHCYSKCMAHRFKMIHRDKWKNMVFNETAFKMKIRKYHRRGFFAFPSHDILPQHKENCYKYIKNNVLDVSKNIVNIITKPNLKAIKYFAEKLGIYKDRIKFFLTITSFSQETTFHYEPNAPNLTERMECMEFLKNLDFDVNGLIEPFWDENPIPLILKLEPYCNIIFLGCDSIYKRDVHKRENLCKIIAEIMKLPKEIIYKIRLKNSFKDKLH